jgi:predicted transcriptional regulator
MYRMDRERRHTDKLNLRIDPDLRAAIQQIAKAKDRSVGWVVRDALTRYIEQEHGLTRP